MRAAAESAWCRCNNASKGEALATSLALARITSNYFVADDSFSEDALKDQKAFYNARYRAGDMQDFTDVLEACCLHPVRSILRQLKGRDRERGLRERRKPRQPRAPLPEGHGFKHHLLRGFLQRLS